MCAFQRALHAHGPRRSASGVEAHTHRGCVSEAVRSEIRGTSRRDPHAGLRVARVSISGTRATTRGKVSQTTAGLVSGVPWPPRVSRSRQGVARATSSSAQHVYATSQVVARHARRVARAPPAKAQRFATHSKREHVPTTRLVWALLIRRKFILETIFHHSLTLPS